MTGLKGNSEFCFLETFNVHLARKPMQFLDNLRFYCLAFKRKDTWSHIMINGLHIKELFGTEKSSGVLRNTNLDLHAQFCCSFVTNQIRKSLWSFRSWKLPDLRGVYMRKLAPVRVSHWFCIAFTWWLGPFISCATETKFSYSLLLAQSIVSNVLKIMVNFIYVKS